MHLPVFFILERLFYFFPLSLSLSPFTAYLCLARERRHDTEDMLGGLALVKQIAPSQAMSEGQEASIRGPDGSLFPQKHPKQGRRRGSPL